MTILQALKSAYDDFDCLEMYFVSWGNNGMGNGSNWGKFLLLFIAHIYA